jgi:hypothetical protein
MSYYLRGAGGVNAVPERMANLCPSGVEQTISGDCTGAIGSLPVTYRLAPGSRGIYNPGPFAVKPYAFWIPQLHCTAGYEPQIAGWQPSCRPVTRLPGAGCARNAPYPGNRNYSYTY